MKRKKSKGKQRNEKQESAVRGVNSREPRAADRRKFLRTVRNLGLVVAAVGTGGWYLVDDIISTSRELDLSRIGGGIPTVVQIHDPQCPKCRALQRETREAMKAFGDSELLYVVANIREASGRNLARTHHVGHVTLLLFDADGIMRETIVGQRSSESLLHVFRRHLAEYGATGKIVGQ